jgi:uncharacterized protein (TIGR03083 family)
MQSFQPIHTAHLFPKLNSLLIELLRSLKPDDWHKPTPAPKWTVKDIAAHLLDTNFRAMSMLRDGYFEKASGDIHSYKDLITFLNQLNADWVQAYRRVSPEILVDLLESSGLQFSAIMAALPPNESALFSVAWAGQEQSPNWFHVAREYAEKWHHQQQIRAAVGLETPLYSKELYNPFLQVSMYALPFQYRNVLANDGEGVKITVLGEGGGFWFLRYEMGEWGIVERTLEFPACEIIIEEAWAWRILMNAANKEQAKAHLTISGKPTLGIPFLGVRAVMV